MNLLLDTHAFIWWIDAGRPLASEAQEAIADPGAIVAVSAASAWEIAIKRATGKLDAPAGLADEITVHGFVPLPITVQHTEAAGDLPLHHRDPFDRLIIAQARAEGLRVVTRDPAFTAYDVRTLTC